MSTRLNNVKKLKLITNNNNNNNNLANNNNNVIDNDDLKNTNKLKQHYIRPDKIIPHQFQIEWFYVLFLSTIHIIAGYGAYLLFSRPLGGYRDLAINLYYVTANIMCMFGIIAGAHRLWSHRSYKARWPLRLILATLQTATIQEDIYEWSLKHRLHHKYSDTDADPTNVSRGFLWAHIGWLFYKRHPAYLAKVPTIDMSDLDQDPIVYWQRKLYSLWVVLVRGMMFTGIPYWLFGSDGSDGSDGGQVVVDLVYLSSMNILFYVILLHYTWLVNSVAHMFGYRPYDTTIQPTDNSVLIYLAFGGGYHNYHHAFPQDYSGSEYSWEQTFNPTTLLIDGFARIGWAYDRKKVSASVIRSRTHRTGDTNQLRAKINWFLDILLGLTILYWPLTVIYGVKLIKLACQGPSGPSERVRVELLGDQRGPPWIPPLHTDLQLFVQ
ncbi:stearoyl-CoA desaturase 5-like [Oppia nitens]|uniref:stearoyl-CoA desaturase 5-like n=1 Tax=Oppia nitens TaxID=1686743 RepID=UPI0023DC26DD|nr:stearoyl-CoA desaturase 5-like [Oppia nitens]